MPSTAWMSPMIGKAACAGVAVGTSTPPVNTSAISAPTPQNLRFIDSLPLRIAAAPPVRQHRFTNLDRGVTGSRVAHTWLTRDPNGQLLTQIRGTLDRSHGCG